MTGKEIRFSRGNKEVVFKLDANLVNKLDKKEKKEFAPLFNAIMNADGDSKNLSAKEFALVEKLQKIFAKNGDVVTGNNLDTQDGEWIASFKKGGDVEEFINAKYNELYPDEVKSKALPGQLPKLDLKLTPINPAEVKIKPLSDNKPQVKAEPTQADKNKQFNLAMQKLASKFDKAELSKNFTKTVEFNKGKYLYNIAKEALQAEGTQNPTAKEINERIAQIALVNGINDVNDVPQDKYPLKVGTGVAAPVDPNGQQPPAAEEVKGGQQQPPASGLKFDKDPDVTGWAEAGANASLPEGVTQGELNGGTLKTYKKGTGDATETKYVYEKDGIKVEAKTVEDLKAKIETIKNALIGFNSVDGEDNTAKQTRLQNAIDALMGLGTESAVKKAQEKLAENKANVSAEYYEKTTIDMLKTGNLELITQILGEEGAQYSELVKNNPEIQKAVGEMLKGLVDKFNNDVYLTLDEQAIKALLDACIAKTGAEIRAEAAAPEVKEGDVVKTSAKAKVFAKSMITDKEGNSYYKAKLDVADGDFKDVEFKAKDKDQLNEFLLDLEAANQISDTTLADDAKKDLFKKYAEMENADPELLKSIAQNASKLKADVESVKKLLDKANLDLVYALDVSGFEDVEENAATGTQAKDDKTQVTTAVKNRIEAIMADETLRALPENAKYLDRIKGVDISGQKTEVTKTTNVSGWGEPTVTKYVKTAAGYAPAAEGATDTVDVNAYTKDGKTVYRVGVNVAGTEVTLEADSPEALLNQKVELEKLTIETENLDDAKKAQNLVNIEKIVELTQDKEVLKQVAEQLKSENINKNAPEAKALVQKLLLTRDADIVRALVEDKTLFGNDPVALKTLAAMFKEIRDLENQGVKLTPEQIALKDVLDDLDSGKVATFGAILEDGVLLRFDGEGNLAVHVDGGGRVAMNATTAESDNTPWGNAILDDPILSKDKHVLAGWNWATNYGEATTKDQILKFIGLDTVDAELLSGQDIENLPSSLSTQDREEITDAYVAKAKKLFAEIGKVGDTEQLDPANARYLNTILDKIDSINDEVTADGKTTDADDAVIAEILANFFTTEGEGENATVKIKDFRRFTYEEMEGLAEAVATHGTDAQRTAIANMITVDDMEHGQFVRAIEMLPAASSNVDSEIVDRFEELVNGMTTKEEVLNFIDKMQCPKFHIPFDKIMEKFGDDQEVVTKLLEEISTSNKMSEGTRKALIGKLVDAEGKVNIPESVNASTLCYLLPQEAAAKTGENATAEVKMDDKEKALFKKVVDSLDASYLDELKVMMDKAKVSAELKSYVDNKVEKLAKEKACDAYTMSKIANNWPAIALKYLLDIKQSTLSGGDQDKNYISDFVKNQIVPSNNPADDDVRKAFQNGWLAKDAANDIGVIAGNDAYDDVNVWGTDNSFEELYCDQNRVNMNTIVDLIDTFTAKSKVDDNMGFLERLNDDGIRADAQNRFIKALMRKAAQLGLENTNEYKALVDLFGAKGTMAYAEDGFTVKKSDPKAESNDTFEFTKNTGNKIWTTETVQAIDKKVDDLLAKVKLWTGRC